MVSLRDFDLPEFPWSLAVDSARGISYTPERHASADREVYYELLQKILGKLSPVFDKNQIAAVLKDFAEKYLSRLRDVYSTKRYIVSPMISGPSGFPVARMKKLNERLEKKERALDEFVEKYMRRVDRMVSQKNIELAGGEEEVTKAKLEEMKELLEGMKEVNKMIRKGALRSAIEEKMRELGFDESKIKGVLEPDYMGRVGFKDFDLRSVRDRIKRLERKLETLAEKKTHEPVEIEEKTEDYKIVRNYNLDRVMIFFSEIPPVELREKLKRNGWHWSPKNKAWMRKLTESAVYDAKRILNDFFGEKQEEDFIEKYKQLPEPNFENLKEGAILVDKSKAKYRVVSIDKQGAPNLWEVIIEDMDTKNRFQYTLGGIERYFKILEQPEKQPESFDVIGALTRSFPEWRELVVDSYFAAKPQQRSLMEKWAKEGYELFDWSTGVGRERSVAETEAKRKGFDPLDIHEINIANYTLWFGKKERESEKEQPAELVPEVVKKKQKVLEEVPPEERQKMEIEKRHRELKKKEEKERREFLEDVSKGKKKPVESLDSWIGQTTLDKFVGVILLLGAGVIAFRFVEDTVSRYR